MAQTASAAIPLRPLAPAPATSSHNSRPYTLSSQHSFSFRALKPLAPSPPSSSAQQQSFLLSHRSAAIAKDHPLPSLSVHEGGKTPGAQDERPLTGAIPMVHSESTGSIATQHTASSSGSSSRDVSITPPTPHEIISGTASVQPSKEWVLPARAKPGRKPSETEPPTKRKAQNRASQRAFRERKQSYVASLEQKIEEYEKRGAEMTMGLQQVASKLKDENEELKRENEALRERIRDLESDKKKERQGLKDKQTLSVGPLQNAHSSINNRLMTKTSKDTAASSDGHVPSSHTIEMNRDCGFCTEGSYCVCKGEASLEESHAEPKALNKHGNFVKISQGGAEKETKKRLWYTSPVSAARQAPPQICPTSQPYKMSRHIPPTVSTLSSDSARPRLWPVYSSGHLQQQHPQQQSRMRAVPIFRLRKSSPLGLGEAAAACTGDPSQCGACSADPALAAFCRAVASQLASNSRIVTPAILDAGNALPLPRKRSFGVSATSRYSSSKSAFQSAGLQSIPEAWNRIKLHPSFPQWQGGLDMLADVVSKRAHAERETDESAAVDVESGDGAVESFLRNDAEDIEDVRRQGGMTKRRRLLVEREGVEDALALLDRGSRASTQTYSKSIRAAGQFSSCECPLRHDL